jgi:hypothetical protein
VSQGCAIGLILVNTLSQKVTSIMVLHFYAMLLQIPLELCKARVRELSSSIVCCCLMHLKLSCGLLCTQGGCSCSRSCCSSTAGGGGRCCFQQLHCRQHGQLWRPTCSALTGHRSSCSRQPATNAAWLCSCRQQGSQPSCAHQHSGLWQSWQERQANSICERALSC